MVAGFRGRRGNARNWWASGNCPEAGQTQGFVAARVGGSAGRNWHRQLLPDRRGALSRNPLMIALDDIREDFGLSDLTVGLLPLAVIFITGIISLPAGNWSDRWKRVNILSAGAIVWGTAGLFAAASANFIQLFLRGDLQRHYFGGNIQKGFWRTAVIIGFARDLTASCQS